MPHQSLIPPEDVAEQTADADQQNATASHNNYLIFSSSVRVCCSDYCHRSLCWRPYFCREYRFSGRRYENKDLAGLQLPSAPSFSSLSSLLLINIKRRPRVETQAINNAALQNASSQIIGARGQVPEIAREARRRWEFLNKCNVLTELRNREQDVGFLHASSVTLLVSGLQR